VPLARWLFTAATLLSWYACTSEGPKGQPSVPEATSSSVALAARGEPAAAAREGLPLFLKKVPGDMASSYGFPDATAMSRAVLGSPYQMASIALDGDNSPVTYVLADEWRFPILVDGTPVALLTVARADLGWEAVDLGAAALAGELGRFERERALGPDVHRALLRLHQLRADVVVTWPAGESFAQGAFTPMQSARTIFALPPGDTGDVSFPLDQTLSLLREKNRVISTEPMH